MGLWNTIKEKWTGQSQAPTQEQRQEIADIFDHQGRLKRIKQELQQKIAAGVVYEVTPEQLGQGFGNEAYEDMLHFIDFLKHSPPEGVNVESLSKTLVLLCQSP
jgi:hypothetical protein